MELSAVSGESMVVYSGNPPAERGEGGFPYQRFPFLVYVYSIMFLFNIVVNGIA